MTNFDGERFAIMSRDGEWRELNCVYSIDVENPTFANPTFEKGAKTTITLTTLTTTFEKALYDRGWKIKMRDYESPSTKHGLFPSVIPNCLKATMQIPFVENVIINPPATIVFWSDGTKTVCKCSDGDTFDPEKGIAMCFFKKMLGSPSQVRKFMKRLIK